MVLLAMLLWSPPTNVAADGTARVEEANAAITYTGDWIAGNRAREWSGGTAALGYAAGQTATLTFNGTGVSWIGFRGPQTGVARVLLDGAVVATVDSYAPTETVRAALYSVTGLATGSHTLTIEPLYAKHEASSDYYVVVDAFDVTTPDGSSVDTAPPAVAITSPGQGATVSGSIAIEAAANDNVAVAGVRFMVDGVQLGAEDIAAPYTMAWNTGAMSNGSHTLTAIARDASGNAATSAPVTVAVSNTAGAADTRVEETSSTIVYDGGWIQANTDRPWSGGTAALGFALGHRATLTFDGTGVRWIGFRGPQTGIARVYLDDALVATIDAYAESETVGAVMYTAAGLPAGRHSLSIEATYTKHVLSSDYYVVVDAFDVTSGAMVDTTPPTVAITEPTDGQPVIGSVTVAATSSDDVGVLGVQFLVDGAQIGNEDTSAPYSVQWDTTTVANGSHVLTAVARDVAGNSATSAPITVTVSNPFPTALRYESSDPSIIYTDGVAAPGRPAGWWHGSRSRSWSGDISSFNRSSGARATFRFTGTWVRWIGFRSYWAGIARVSIDGGPFTSIDLFIPPCTAEQRAQGCRDEEPQAAVFSASGLAPGVEHVLVIEATGTKHGGESCAPAPSSTCSLDYAVVVDAIDVAPAAPARTTGTRFDDAHQAVAYAGTWQSDADLTNGWHEGMAAVSDTSGSSATFTFAGTSVNWVGLRGPATGIARIYLDGALEQEIDTYSAVEVTGVVFSATNLAVGSHTLRIEVAGTRNPKSSGNAVYVDAFDVRSRFEDLDPSVVFSTDGAGAGWSRDNADKAWSGASANVGTGTAARALTAGSRAEFTFNGTAVSWIGMRGPASGIADVYLDEAFVSRVDLYAATEQLQAKLLSLTNLTAGPHTFRIDVTGDRNPASTSTIVVVDAFDVTISTPQALVSRFQENTPPVVLSSGWTSGSRFSFWSGEFATLSATTGARATFTFSGTAVRWIGERRRTGGIARVYLDGAFVADVDTYWWLQDEFQAALFSRTGLTPGTHTLMIEVLGQKRGGPSCTGSPSPTCSAGYDVVVDAFDVQ